MTKEKPPLPSDPDLRWSTGDDGMYVAERPLYAPPRDSLEFFAAIGRLFAACIFFVITAALCITTWRIVVAIWELFF